MEKEKNGEDKMQATEEKEEIERNLVECEQYDNSIKVIILGDSNVGKSSLINRLKNNKFADLASTLSIENHSYIISINNYKLRMQLWDTAGQERYNSIITNYYKGSDVAIFVYSIDSAETFENLSTWMKLLKENNENTLNILIGNKLDREKEEGGRAVIYENAENFARDNNFFLFREISCKSKEKYDVEDIYEIFDEIGKYFYEKSKESVKAESISYKISDSMRTLGEKHKIKKQNEKNKAKKSCCL